MCKIDDITADSLVLMDCVRAGGLVQNEKDLKNERNGKAGAGAEGGAGPLTGRAELLRLQRSEPLLTASPRRWMSELVKGGAEYADIAELDAQHQAAFWSVGEINLSEDLAHFDALREQERGFLLHTLAYFAASDMLVNENLVGRFQNEVHVAEIQNFWTTQAFFENIHTKTYVTLLRTYLRNRDEELDRLQRGIETIPSIRAKADFALRRVRPVEEGGIADDEPFALRLAAFAFVEGVMFSSSFASIFWFKKRGLLPGLTFSNELISRDEGLHVKAAAAIFGHLLHRPSVELMHGLAREACGLEVAFVREGLPAAMLGMNADLMEQHVRFTTNYVLELLGYPALYEERRTPFEFMELISLEGKTNFFEKKVGEYQKSGIVAGTQEKVLSLDEDF